MRQSLKKKSAFPQLSYKNYQNPFNSIALLGVDWHNTLEKYLWLVLKQPPIYFKNFKRKDIPTCSGVYVITDIRNPINEQVVYVGDTGNLRNRLYSHIIGSKGNSPCVRYLINDKIETDIIDKSSAQQYMKNNFAYRFIKCEEEWKDTIKLCGYVEAYITAILAPRYGVYIEK